MPVNKSEVTRRDFLKVAALVGLSLSVPSFMLEDGWYAIRSGSVRKGIRYKKGIISDSEAKNALIYWFNNTEFYRFPVKIKMSSLSFVNVDEDYGMKSVWVAQYIGRYKKLKA